MWLFMFELPPPMIAEADQAKAHADRLGAAMAMSLRTDLAAGMDRSFLWWTYSNYLTQEHPWRLAAVLTAALLQLAERAPTETEDILND